MNNDMIRQIDLYYTKKAEEFGATYKGVDWNSERSQKICFEQLTKLFDHEKNAAFTLCDFGCGYGAYIAYLEEQGYPCSYTGIDVSEKMITFANEKYGTRENTVFIQDSRLDKIYDYITACGIFNIRQNVEYGEWTDYMVGMLEEFHAHSKKGFAFNCLTKYSDAEYMKDYLYYADPSFYFDYAKRHFSRNVALLHDYGLYEFTLIVRKSN